jgi:hypothetical protein
MSGEYGVIINSAVRAVAQMHADTSKLLIDCDKRVGRARPSVFGSYATKGLTYSYRADQWMAEGVFRYYASDSNNVDGVTVSFWEETTEEPMFMIAQIRYQRHPDSNPLDDEAADIKRVCKEWDIWNLYFWWGERKGGTVLEYTDSDEGRIASARLIAIPLYSINSIETVEALYDRVNVPVQH